MKKPRATWAPRPGRLFRHVVLPLIGPSVVGIGMFGFTLSWDEIARTSQAIGDVNTLPLELQGLTSTVTTPVDLRAGHRHHRGVVCGDGRGLGLVRGWANGKKN
jgi:hypothetical protein